MTRFPFFALLGLALLSGCAEPTAGSLALVSDGERACEADREAARAEAGFRLQAEAAEVGYAGSDEAALALDRRDARMASDIATAAFERCMTGG